MLLARADQRVQGEARQVVEVVEVEHREYPWEGEEAEVVGQVELPSAYPEEEAVVVEAQMAQIQAGLDLA